MRFLAAIVVVAAVAFGAAAFLAGDDDGGGSGVPCPAADGRTAALRDCLEDHLVFVETNYSVGSGVLLPDGHIITNAHVIDPYATVDLAFSGGERHEDVEVVGVDAFADVAVLGPIETERRGVELRPLPALDVDGEPEVFLVGYPGGVEGDDPQISLSSGVLSRLRELDSFGQTYLQTDAAISGGQSGGVLVDAAGRILGLSGLSFADEFALALSTTNVLASIDAVLAGEGSERFVVPDDDEDLVQRATLQLDDVSGDAGIVFPANDDPRTVRLTVPPERAIALSVFDISAIPILANQATLDLYDISASDAGVEVVEPDETGTYELELFPGEDVIVGLLALEDDPAPIEVSADAGFLALDGDGEPNDIEPDGEARRGVLNVLENGDDFAIDLDEGDRVQITVRSPSGDVFYDLVAPSEEFDATAQPDGDDGGGGLYDLDARETHDIDESGTYRLRVNAYDGVVIGYEVVVELGD